MVYSFILFDFLHNFAIHFTLCNQLFVHVSVIIGQDTYIFNNDTKVLKHALQGTVIIVLRCHVNYRNGHCKHYYSFMNSYPIEKNCICWFDIF